MSKESPLSRRRRQRRAKSRRIKKAAAEINHVMKLVMEDKLREAILETFSGMAIAFGIASRMVMPAISGTLMFASNPAPRESLLSPGFYGVLSKEQIISDIPPVEWPKVGE